MKVIDVKGLTKKYGNKAVVDGVDLMVEEGEIVGFLGPNGSGKTTTIRMLCGLLRPDAGEGTCLGHDLQRAPERIKPQIGYMTQRFSFYEDLTIRENLDFVARLYGLKPRRRHVEAAIARLGLGHRRDQLAGTLSGGWKQRLALAACIMHAPRLLLLDEPTAGVDPKARRDFWDEIHDLAADGLTVLVSTHYMDEAERCTRIVYILEGRILVRGTAEEVVANAGLSTWVLEGRGLAALADELRALPAVEQVAPFGNTLHVVGSDAARLEQSLAPYAQRAGMTLKRGQTSLEDVFIQHMAQAPDPHP
ncbi:MAG: ABC transporter ATP-binding protein [Alphaproteobacteria bacterium]|nr:MAG: ABC transporter ATP-binding protein [Alphaproteobacteria bacterium]